MILMWIYILFKRRWGIHRRRMRGGRDMELEDWPTHPNGNLTKFTPDPGGWRLLSLRTQ